MNLYAYVYNNPLKFIDPSGHCGVLANGNFHDCNGVDTQLLQLKLDYSKASTDAERNRIRDNAASLRASSGRHDEKNNPNGYTVMYDKGLDYYTIPDVTDKLNGLMLKYEYMFDAESKRTWVVNLEVFYNTVKNKAELDLKNLPDWQHSHFVYDGEIVDKDVPGNISYGYFGKVLNIPDFVLKSGAGAAQIAAGTSSIKFFTSYGDDPRDTARIKQGIQIYSNWHRK